MVANTFVCVSSAGSASEPAPPAPPPPEAQPVEAKAPEEEMDVTDDDITAGRLWRVQAAAPSVRVVLWQNVLPC